MTEEQAEQSETVLSVSEVDEIRDQWSGSVYEGAIVRLCDSHEALRSLGRLIYETAADLGPKETH